jgi:N-methylhydantoinase B/oxoprolinase/acetone carboxylase alpha subunit
MTIQDFAALIAAIATGLAGVTAMLRFLVIHYLSELKNNGGSSMRDAVDRLETRVDKIYEILCDK